MQELNRVMPLFRNLFGIWLGVLLHIWISTIYCWTTNIHPGPVCLLQFQIIKPIFQVTGCGQPFRWHSCHLCAGGLPSWGTKPALGVTFMSAPLPTQVPFTRHSRADILQCTFLCTLKNLDHNLYHETVHWKFNNHWIFQQDEILWRKVNFSYRYIWVRKSEWKDLHLVPVFTHPE